MIKHCVFLKFKPEHSIAERNEVFQQLIDLKGEINGLLDVEFGENLDFENKSADYTGGFVATFTDQKSLSEYAEHPKHKIAGGRLVDMCVDGYAGIMVYDLDV